MELPGRRIPVPGRAVPEGLTVHLTAVSECGHLLDEGAPLLGDAELRRATRPAPWETQRRRLLSYVLLRRLLAERLDVSAADLEFGAAPEAGNAAPVLRAAGGAGTLPRFSLSRSSRLIAVAIAPGAVGVDVEELQTPEQANQLLATLHPADRRRLQRLPGPLRARAVTAAWVRKEAGVKALGTGLLRDPARDRTGSRRVPLGPPGVTVAQLRLPRTQRAELAVAWTRN